jgi:hypothetical protein
VKKESDKEVAEGGVSPKRRGNVMRLTKCDMNLLPELNGLLHDRWFDVDNLAFDELREEFRLIFGKHKALHDQYLVISGVLGYKLTDREHIGIYDIYELSVNLERRKILITGCIPISIELDVSEDFEIVMYSEQPPASSMKGRDK